MTRLRVLPLAVLPLTACYEGHGAGSDGADQAGTATEGGTDTAETDTDDSTDPPPAGMYGDPRALGPVPMRRLSLAELRATLQSLFGPQPDDLLHVLPPDGHSPFDNDAQSQVPSKPWVEGMRHIATVVADQVTADDATRDAFIGCAPTGPDDEACLRSFVETFGRRALRRPLDPADVDAYAGLIEFAIEEDDFDVAVRLVVEAIVQDPQFAYRLEAGESVPGDPNLVLLDDYEVASRLSYLLWGLPPDDEMLDAAQADALSDRAAVRDEARRMLDDPRATEQLQRFHALWLEYEALPLEPSLADALRRETDALVQRAVEQGDWTTLFTSPESFLTPELAEHYGLDIALDDDEWVEYPDSTRGGLLSHGSVLSVGKKFGDTSPVERGKHIWTRMLCRDIAPPPPDVDSGIPPSAGPASACKPQRYNMSELPECAGCHSLLDPLGFGLENYGPAGEWRDHEPDRPDCEIAGQGELSGEGAFEGPAELGQLLLDTGDLQPCVTRHFVQFAVGRPAGPDDESFVEQLGDDLTQDPDFEAVVLEFVGSESFRHRVID